MLKRLWAKLFPPAKEYVIQDSRKRDGNNMIFWAKGEKGYAKGYTMHLDEAQAYTKAQAEDIHAHSSTDVPRKFSDVFKAASLQVDVQRFRG
jgi:hypothetical protein